MCTKFCKNRLSFVEDITRNISVFFSDTLYIYMRQNVPADVKKFPGLTHVSPLQEVSFPPGSIPSLRRGACAPDVRTSFH